MNKGPNAKTKRSDKSDNNRQFSFEYLNHSSVQQPLNLEKFIEWIALPRTLRKPKTQKEFAKSIGVNQDTLSDWKKLPNFWKEVNLYHRLYFRSQTADVLNGLLQTAKTGRAAEVKLFLEYFEGYYGKELTLTEPTSLAPEQAERITNAIKHWFSDRPWVKSND
jgi:hypothetical protein